MKTLRRPPSRRSFLGQASSKDEEAFNLYFKTVSRDGVFYRVGYVVSNTQYFQPFRDQSGIPDSARQVRLYVLSGPNAGAVEYTQLPGFSSRYQAVPEESAEAALLNLPVAVPRVKDTALQDFYKTVQSGFSMAENALSQARLGDLKAADRGINLVGAGAAAMLDKANFEVHELEDIGLITHADRAFLMTNVVNPLAGVITDARTAIRDGQTSSLLALWNFAKELTARTAVQWESFGSGKWKEVISLYKESLAAIASLEASIAALEAVGSPSLSEDIARQKKVLSLMKFQVQMVKDKVIGLGVSQADWNREVGLGELSTITVIILSTVLAIFLQTIVNYIIEAIRESNRTAARLQEMREERAQNRLLDEEEKAAELKRLDAAISKNTASSEERVGILDKIQKNYPSMNLGPKIDELKKGASEKSSVAQAGDFFPYVVAGGIGLALAVAIIWIRRKKDF